MRPIITVSYTSFDSGGGVPKFNRDLHAAFPDREKAHFCWQDFPWHSEIDAKGETEWGRARLLNDYLIRSKLIKQDDIVVADGFWASGLEHLPFAISHSHGIWSHLTDVDVALGKAPDMPFHHAAQVQFRKRWTDLGKHITAVSDFIAEQMEIQWGFIVDRVINNGVDTAVYEPSSYKSTYLHRPLIIHGINDRGNMNKGWDHIAAIENEVDAYVWSLDEAFSRFQLFSDRPWEKNEILAQADLVVHPSGYEGNSMFIAETLASGVPLVCYNVGFAYWLSKNLSWSERVGVILDRNKRSPATTLSWVKHMLDSSDENESKILKNNCRAVAEKHLDISIFAANWRNYISEIENKNAT